MDQSQHILIQISDLHIEPADTPTRHGHGTDTTANLEAALRRIEESQVRADAVVFTGDLTERGRPEEYRRLRAVLEPARQRLDVPFVYVMGNHDDRAALRAELLGEQPGDHPGGADPTAPLDHVVRLGDLRVVVLDTSVPGNAWGELTDAQLDWLRAELAEPAPHGTVLALHHPPMPSALPMEAAIELQHREQLVEVLTGTDVRLLLAGHTHLISGGAVAGIPVWTSGTLASACDPLPPDAGYRVVRQPTIARIDLFADAVLTAAVPVHVDVIGALDRDGAEKVAAKMFADLPGRS